MDIVDLASGRHRVAEGALSVCNRLAAVTAVPHRGTIVAAGGADMLEYGDAAASMRGQQRYDPREGRWQVFGEMRSSFRVPESLCAVDDSLFAPIGAALWRLDLRSGRWHAVAEFAYDCPVAFSGLL